MLVQTATMPVIGYSSGRAERLTAAGLFAFSVCGILILTALYSSQGTFWSELYSDLYEVTLAIATFTALLCVFLTRHVPDQVISALIEQGVIIIDQKHPTEIRLPHRFNGQLVWFIALLMLFWALGGLALYLGNIRPADFDRFGTWDILCGRFVWVSLFAWFFWRSIRATQALRSLLKSCALRPRLWTAVGDGGLGKIGVAILALALPLIIAAVLGLVWLLPSFAGNEGYQGAQAVAGVLAMVVGLVLVTVFVPCVWTAHVKIEAFRVGHLEATAQKLRALSSSIDTDSGRFSAGCDFAALNGLWSEIARLPSWPFSTKAGIFFIFAQLLAIGTALIKARETFTKLSSLFG